MNYDEVVDLIVEEISKKIGLLKPLDSPPKKTAIVMNNINTDEITKVLGSDYKVSVYGKEDKEGDIIIIPSLSLKAMASIATLTIDGEKENFIIRMLMMGKEVYALEDGLEYRKYKNTAPRALYSKYLDFEQQLKIHGIKIIGYIGEVKKANKNLLNSIEPSVINDRVQEGSIGGLEVEIRNKKVIDEAQIRNNFIPEAKVIVIDKKSIITPLAADFIRTHHLSVKRG